MGPIAWADAATGWILGWTLIHSLWQGALVAAGLALVLRLVPGSWVRFRGAAAWGALLLVIALAAATWLFVDLEWREHAACWTSEAYAREHAGVCSGHAVPAARAMLEEGEKRKVAVPLAWARRWALPIPGSLRSASRAATGGVPLVALAWSALLLLALVRLSLGLGRLSKVLRRGRPPADAGLDGVLRRMAAKMAVDAPIEIRESAEIATPGVAGWRRPVILLPRGVADALGPDQLADVLAHELVHVQRRHFAVNLLQRGLDCLCTLNPFALWISGRIREEREVHCDRLVAGVSAREARRYLRTLLQLEGLRAPSGPALVGLCGEGCLLRRVKRLLEPAPGRPQGRVRRGAALAAGVTTAVIVVHLSLTTVALTSWAVMSHDIAVRRAISSSVTAGDASPPDASAASSRP